MVDGARHFETNDWNETYDTYDSTSGDMPAEFIAGYVTGQRQVFSLAYRF